MAFFRSTCTIWDVSNPSLLFVKINVAKQLRIGSGSTN